MCAHEATHAAAMIHLYVDEDLDVDSEIHAYLIGWLTEWLYVNVT